MEQEDLELRRGEGFNPTSSLTGPKGGDLKETHDWIQVIDLQMPRRYSIIPLGIHVWDFSFSGAVNQDVDGGLWFCSQQGSHLAQPTNTASESMEV